MSFNRETEIDLEYTATFLKEALNKVMTQENPDLLNDLKKVFKKTVPFSKRMYVAAYLVKEAQLRTRHRFTSRHDNSHAHHGAHNFSRSYAPREVHESAFSETHADEQLSHMRTQIDEAHAATIFISIGRNRRVYPRDLVGLLVSVAHLDRDRIGNIRVLADYSFVQLFKDDTEKTISALNGYDYRGRKLVVSYSRQRGDEESPFETEHESVPEATGKNDAPIHEVGEVQNVLSNGASDQSSSQALS